MLCATRPPSARFRESRRRRKVGRVVTKLKITNHADLVNAAQATRSVEIEALVDTGATMLALPEDVVQKLGVTPHGTRRVRDARGITIEVPWVGGLLIE